jgi:hypothetical protein
LTGTELAVGPELLWLCAAHDEREDALRYTEPLLLEAIFVSTPPAIAGTFGGAIAAKTSVGFVEVLLAHGLKPSNPKATAVSSAVAV